MKIGFAYSAADTPHNGLGPFQLLGTPVDLRYSDVTKCDAIVLWGGTDINPAIYGAIPHPMNGYNPSSMRDETEQFYIRRAVEHNIPIIGVCRGAQLVCAMAGGKLVQHMNGHGSDHDIVTKDGKVYQSSSSHHQMMYPFGMPEECYDILAWSSIKRSTKYEGENGNRMDTPEVEPEVVLFPKIRALAIQGHPEWMEDEEPFVQWCLRITRDL